MGFSLSEDGPSQQPLLRAFSSTSSFNTPLKLPGTERPSPLLRRTANSCGNLSASYISHDGTERGLKVPVVLAVCGLLALVAGAYFLRTEVSGGRGMNSVSPSAQPNLSAVFGRQSSLLPSAEDRKSEATIRSSPQQVQVSGSVQYEDDDMISDPDSKITSHSIKCSCENGHPLNCETGIKLNIATTICPAARIIQDRRRAMLCDQRNIDAFLARTPATKSYRLRDGLAKLPCAEERNITHTTTSKSRLSRAYKQRKTQQALLETVPVLAAMPILTPLFNGTRDNLFYTRKNMWALRGWRPNGKPLHAEPFTKETEPYLPEKAPGVLYDTCAVIGNSGILLEQRRGEEIDSHTAIIRTNQAPTNARLAPFVGNRTDVRVLNRHWSRRYATSARNLLDMEAPGMLLIPSRAATKNVNEFGEASMREHSNKTFLFPTTQMILSSSSMVSETRLAIKLGSGLEYNGGNSPSSGLVAILLGLRICNKLDVYGFSLRNCIGRCPKYHYFRRNEVPDRVRTMSFVGHQYDAEGMIIKALHVLGLLCVVPQPPDIGKCGSHFNGLVDSLTAQDGGINRLLSKEGVDELLRDPRKSVGLSTVAEDGAARRVTVRRPATRQRRGATSGQYRSRIM